MQKKKKIGKKNGSKNRNGNLLTKLPFKKKVKIKLKELPALFRARKEEKKHLLSDKELLSEQHSFEKYAMSMKKFILRPKKKK